MADRCIREETAGLNNSQKTTYNELDIMRFCKGERTQPDYMIAYMNNGTISPHIDQLKKLINDWESELPIVIIDIDECIKEQTMQINELFKTFNEFPSVETAQEILRKIDNNTVTTRRFHTNSEFINCRENVQRYLDKSSQTKDKVDLEQLKENHESITVQERKDGISEIRRLREKIQEIVSKGKEDKDDR